MSVRVRFAPSPTGFLHVGGARTALFNYLFARAHGGVFVLRIEDTDAARSTEESVRAIVDSLRWLGLTWDEGPEAGGPRGPYFQSQRRPLYGRHAGALRDAGRAYPCYCTSDELEAMRAEEAARREPLRYDGRCRSLTPAERARLEAAGRTPVLRLAQESEGETAWVDEVRGRVAFQNDQLDDFVLLRSDGLPTYNFSCVVDDHEMAISHVIRGDDHLSNTPRQLGLYRAFDWEPPRFAHVSMILGSDGSRLSKRHGATSVAAYRELGYIPPAMVNFLALLGWAYDDRTEIFTLAELERFFSLERVGLNPAVFNLEKLEWLNGQHLMRLTEAERTALVTEYLAARGHDLSQHPAAWWADFVRAAGARLKTLADIERYGAFALQDPPETDPVAWAGLLEKPGVAERLTRLADRLAEEPDDSLAGLERTTRAVAAELGIKAGDLMSAARVAITGRSFAPGLFDVMALLGRPTVIGRLRQAAVRWSAESSRGPG